MSAGPAGRRRVIFGAVSISPIFIPLPGPGRPRTLFSPRAARRTYQWLCRAAVAAVAFTAHSALSSPGKKRRGGNFSLTL